MIIAWITTLQCGRFSKIRNFFKIQHTSFRSIYFARGAGVKLVKMTCLWVVVTMLIGPRGNQKSAVLRSRTNRLPLLSKFSVHCGLN